MKTKSRKTIRKMRTMEKHTSSLQLLIQSSANALGARADAHVTHELELRGLEPILLFFFKVFRLGRLTQ